MFWEAKSCHLLQQSPCFSQLDDVKSHSGHGDWGRRAGAARLKMCVGQNGTEFHLRTTAVLFFSISCECC